MTTNTHIAAQALRQIKYKAVSLADAQVIALEALQALEAAPALDAQGERSGFPPRIMKLLLEVAEREGKGSRGPWEDGDGEPLQEDADAAISWIDHMASAPLPHAVGKPLSNAQFVKCIEAAGFKKWDSRTWSLKREIEAAHGIVTKETGT